MSYRVAFDPKSTFFLKPLPFLLLLLNGLPSLPSARADLVFRTADLIYYNESELLCIVFQDLHNLISVYLSSLAPPRPLQSPASVNRVPSQFPNTPFSSSLQASIPRLPNKQPPSPFIQILPHPPGLLLQPNPGSELSLLQHGSSFSCSVSTYLLLPWIIFWISMFYLLKENEHFLKVRASCTPLPTRW